MDGILPTLIGLILDELSLSSKIVQAQYLFRNGFQILSFFLKNIGHEFFCILAHVYSDQTQHQQLYWKGLKKNNSEWSKLVFLN